MPQPIQVISPASPPQSPFNTLLATWLLMILLSAWPNQAVAREGFAGTTDAGALEYFLVITGGELLEGVYPDAHTAFITRTLLPLGCRCVGSLVVDDEHNDLIRALQFASERADLVIVTGGLGPTPDDITRETVASFLNVELREDPELIEFLARRFGQPRDQLRPNVRRQALIPIDGRYLPNPLGTSAGIIYPGPPPIVALPGPPRELQAMVHDALIPYLQQHFGVRPPDTSITLRFVGAGQSLISQTLENHDLYPPNVTVGSLFEGGRVDFTFSLPGHSPDDRRQLEELTDQIRKHLGEYLYATDGSSLEDAVVAGFLARQASLAVVEIGSGGLISATLQAGKGADQLLTATLAAPTPERMERLLPQPHGNQTSTAIQPVYHARDLARQARQSINASWAITAVPDSQTDTANPQIHIVLAMPEDRWSTTRLAPPRPDPADRFRFATRLLDWLRRELANSP